MSRLSLTLLLLAGACAFLAPAPCGAQDVEPRPDLLQVIPGFKTKLYANVSYARSLISIKKGRATITYVGSRLGWGTTLSDVWAIVDSNSDGKPEYTWQLVKQLNTPSGIALDKNNDILYVSGFQNTSSGDLKGMVWSMKDVSKYALRKKEYQISDLTVVSDKLPGDPYHGWRYMRMNKDGDIVIPVGLNCNTCTQNTTADGIKFGTIYKLNPQTGAFTLIADGVRNCVGLDFHPDSGHMYFTDNGRDLLGDDLPDCKLNVLMKEGQNFGIPYCLNVGSGDPWKRNLGPGTPMNDPDMNPNGTVMDCLAKGAYVQPVQEQGPHVAPLGMKFYRWSKDANFPRSYDRAAFIVHRGSWNRQLKIGYRVMLVRIDDKARPPKSKVYKEFMWGWLQNKNDLVSQYSWGESQSLR
eukprot:GHUV01012549.1.p1 GENE.GHUV01012549.1~~GHUV01012549.1.p1  ORF type:complete len:431 (+),score=68.85 GHUV01012549.1:66-1295(+)